MFWLASMPPQPIAGGLREQSHARLTGATWKFSFRLVLENDTVSLGSKGISDTEQMLLYS